MSALFTIEQIDQSELTVFSGGSTSSLANNAGVVSGSAYNNVNGGTAGLVGYKRGKFRFSGTFGAAPSANSGIAIYAIRGDSTGSTFETSSVTPPPNLPIATIPVDATNTTQTRDSDDVDLPAGYWKLMLVNSATGQSISSGWSLTLEPISDAGF